MQDVQDYWPLACGHSFGRWRAICDQGVAMPGINPCANRRGRGKLPGAVCGKSGCYSERDRRSPSSVSRARSLRRDSINRSTWRFRREEGGKWRRSASRSVEWIRQSLWLAETICRGRRAFPTSPIDRIDRCLGTLSKPARELARAARARQGTRGPVLTGHGDD